MKKNQKGEKREKKKERIQTSLLFFLSLFSHVRTSLRLRPKGNDIRGGMERFGGERTWNWESKVRREGSTRRGINHFHCQVTFSHRDGEPEPGGSQSAFSGHP